MRSIFVVVISLSLVVLPCLGCGGESSNKPNPDDPGFVDPADPENLEAGGLPQNPSADPVAGGAPAEE